MHENNLNRTEASHYITDLQPFCISLFLFFFNFLEPSTLRQDLVTFALFLADLRPTPPLSFFTLPRAMILQPPIHNLTTDPVRRSYT
jgi:hypothetical protein